MNADSLQRRALALFDAALEQPAEGRSAWVAEACGGDAALEAEVRALLTAANVSAGILDAPPHLDPPPDLAQLLGSALAESYVLEREIGRGGMSTVFLAEERKHARQVVIKVLEPAIALHFGAERFLREVRIAATLAHPHIVPLIDSGEADGLLYYVMPYMGGETLRARLPRGRLTIEEGLLVLHDVAGALDFAHRRGVVHRDLKPENVLLTGAHAYLLDFGIAKLHDDGRGGGAITAPGVPLGTRRYMAPEQRVAADDVDARADIYAWGVLGAEVFHGQPLPPGEAAVVVPGVLAARSDLPPLLVELLCDCVSTTPERRPASMGEVVRRLDEAAPRVASQVSPAESLRAVTPGRHTRRTGLGIAGGLLLAGVAAAAIVLTSRRGASTHSAIPEPVAVTVLRNETGDSALSVIGRFAGDFITDGLQRMGTVRVVPWSEALLASESAAASGSDVVKRVREESGAGTVVTGAFYRLRDSLHLQAQISDARSGSLLSSTAPVVVSASQPEEGVAQLRDRVMGAVAAARDERVATLPDVTRHPPSFSAYQAFDRGLDRFLDQQYSESLREFRDAFARDTTFTVALLQGARAAWNSGNFAVAETLVVRARAQDRDLGTYHESSLRFIEALLQGDGRAARAAVERAAEIAPNSRAGFDRAAAFLNAGMARAAEQQLRQMDPDRGEMRGWSSYWTQLAHAAYLLGAHDRELNAAREMARRHPDRRVALVLEARALAAALDTRRLDSALVAWESLPANVYWSQGAAMVVASEELLRRERDDEGRRYAERAVAWLTNRLVATPNDRAHRYWLGCALYDLSRFEEARPYFESLATEFPERLQYRGLAATVAARRGDRAAAERWLGYAAPRDEGEHLAFRARIAAVMGDHEEAITLLTTAVDRGIEGFPWLPGSAFRDLLPLMQDPRARALLAGR